MTKLQIGRLSMLLFALLLSNLVGLAKVSNEEIMHLLNKEKGLAGSSVSYIMTDHVGQIWIATSNGVNRFNGKNLETFPINKSDHSPVYVYDICEGTDKAIYLATDAGIYVLHYGNSEFKRILPTVKTVDCVLFVSGKLYFGNRAGLHIYDGRKIEDIVVGPSRVSLDNSVRDIVPNHGKIWFVSKYALNCYNPSNGKVKSYLLTLKMPERTALCQLSIWQSKFYLGTKNNGLWVWNGKTRQLKNIPDVGNVVTRMVVSADGKLCVANDGAGAFLIDCKRDGIEEHYSMDGDVYHQLPTDAVYCFYRDQNGVNWFGFYRQGMLYTYHSEPLFHTYRFGNFSTDGLNVLGFCIRGKEIVIGTNEGIYYINERLNRVKHISSDALGGAHIISKIVYYQGNFYIGSYDGGVRVFNPNTYAVSPIVKIPLLSKTSVGAMAVSPQQQLWISTTEGIYVLDPTGKWNRYTESNSRIYGGMMNSILFDYKGQAWINSSFGMMLYLTSSHQFVYDGFPQGFFSKESSLTGGLGHHGRLYFYNKSGVWYTDPDMRDFGHLALPSGLLDESCYAFLDDFRGNYWIVTDKGLFRMNYALSNLQHFGYGEGVRSLLINALSLSPNGDKKVWVATSDGLLNVDEQALERWQRNNRYRVLLYRIRVGGDLIGGTEESLVNEHKCLTLKWNLTSTSLIVEPVLNDFARQDGRLYEYRLDGEKKWTYTQNGEEIKIIHLTLGVHQLSVRLAGVPGTTGNYQITVVPSWLAVLELLLLCMAIVLFFLWLRYRKNTNLLLNERNDIEDALVEAEQERHQKEENPVQDPTPKYDRVHLNRDECEQIVRRMKLYIEETKIYKNPDLKMSDVAEHLHLSSSKLSQVFSLYLKENYYEFINQYRLAEFKQLVDDGECSKYTLTALSAKCGFKKSSFFSTFRKVEGMTPTEYLKSHNVKF